MPNPRTRRTALPAAAVVCVLLSGCSGGSTDSADSAADALKHPCTLLTAAEGGAVLRRPPGTGLEIVNGDASECAYKDGGLYVIVAHAPYTRKSFHAVVYGTRGGRPAVPEPGLGDAAYGFRESGTEPALLDVLKGSRLVQITSPTLATDREAARAVLPRVP